MKKILQKLLNLILWFNERISDYNCKRGKHTYIKVSNMLSTGGACKGKSYQCWHCGKFH